MQLAVQATVENQQKVPLVTVIMSELCIENNAMARFWAAFFIQEVAEHQEKPEAWVLREQHNAIFDTENQPIRHFHYVFLR